MTELLSQSLASIVTRYQPAAAVFEKYQLDFCCKGKRTLQEACKENKVNPAEVLLDIEKAGTPLTTDQPDPATMELGQLAEYIVSTHHAYVKREMPLIDGYLRKVAAKHGERHPEMYRVSELFSALKEEMEMHMQKEEKVLFPRIAEVENAVQAKNELHINTTFLTAPVSVMEQEHDHAGSLMAEIRKLTNGYTPPADACTTYKVSFASLQAFEQDLHRHVHLENYILFPKAIELFTANRAASLN